MSILAELRDAYLYWRLVRKVRSLPDPKLAHQDDASPEEVEQAMQFRREGKVFLFAGDLPADHPMQAIARRMVAIAVRVRNGGILGGICGGCGTVRGHWPATGRELQISGWSIRDDGGPGMALMCPGCAECVGKAQGEPSDAHE